MRNLFGVCALAVTLAGQGTDAIVTGNVTDPSGAAVPGVRVMAQNTKTGVAAEVRSNDAGVYVFPALQPGMYRIAVEQTGFRLLAIDNISLQVGARLDIPLRLSLATSTETVEVQASGENIVETTAVSVGGVLSGQQVLDLPLPGRNALDLVYTQAGLVGDNFAGTRIGSLNITIDGINAQDQRLNQGVSSPILTTVDKVEEFRIVTSPADAEYGRGSGQIQMITRSGTNKYTGSLFEFHRNTVLNANTWFNNQRGHDSRTGEQISPRNILIRNQYGGRIGGPIKKNQTFFFFLYDSQRIRQKAAVTNTVFTDTMRQGRYRYFPGAQNANSNGARPTVDDQGNPTPPSTATAALQTVDIFSVDPNRNRPDATGSVARMIALMPQPNNFRFGDGLNTAGFTWQRPSAQNLNQWNLKLDHNFNTSHRASLSYVNEGQANRNLFSEQPFPNSPGGRTEYKDRLWTLNVTSTLKPNVLNEFRSGVLRPWLRFFTGWEVGDAIRQLPTATGQPFLFDFVSISEPLNIDDNPVGRISPLYQFSDNVTWIRGRHSFKGGADVRFSSTNGFNSTDVMPRGVIGTGGVPVQNLQTVAGLGQNQGSFINILNDLTGTMTSIRQAFNSPGGPQPQYLPNEVKQRTWKRREYGFFFKDDWKVSQRLTLNLGGRWDYYGVPYDANGRTANLVGGQAALFGISGTGYGDLYQPGRSNGSLTRVETVGPNSENPGRHIHAQDRNNFAPAVGFSWHLPGFQKATVLRMGYMINYERNSLRVVDVVSGDQPGLRERVTFTSAEILNPSTARLPLPTNGRPLETVPLTDRLQIVRAFQDDLRNPYIQNWNASVQRELPWGMALDARYVANKGTRLVRGTSINEENIFENGILDAFLVTQAGGHAPLFNRIFNGLNIPGVGRVDGVNITGSDAVRGNSVTQTHLALHDVASLASYLNSSNAFTGVNGGLLRRAGLPENFVVANPQFASARLTGNFANSTYHSAQLEVRKRFSRGAGFQANYTWSKTLGEEEGAGEEMIDSYRSVRNMSLDKRKLSFHRGHVFRSSGTWEPRFIPRKGWAGRLGRDWRFGAIFNAFSGEPITLTSGRSTLNTFGDNTPTAVGPLAPNLGNSVRTGNGVVYFEGFGRTPDPSVARLTAVGGVRGRSSLEAITDPQGNLVLVQPTPGILGNLQPNFLEGPGDFRFDVNVQRVFQLTERVQFELRGDAIDVTNSPQWSAPNVNMNSQNFGRITGAGGNRIIVVGGRINF
ncbi:MAG: hypothetical protein FJW30_24570 [Acidobacteria bacterium]|nr:hypothetical protein [Acidobacteriota bacterium]